MSTRLYVKYNSLPMPRIASAANVRYPSLQLKTAYQARRKQPRRLRYKKANLAAPNWHPVSAIKCHTSVTRNYAQISRNLSRGRFCVD